MTVPGGNDNFCQRIVTRRIADDDYYSDSIDLLYFRLHSLVPSALNYTCADPSHPHGLVPSSLAPKNSNRTTNIQTLGKGMAGR